MRVHTRIKLEKEGNDILLVGCNIHRLQKGLHVLDVRIHFFFFENRILFP